MSSLLQDYLPVVIFIGVSAVIGIALLVAPFLVAFSRPDPEKMSAYECGFNAFDDARMKFDVRFYLVSILFIIFDLEVAFLFPWAGSRERRCPPVRSGRSPARRNRNSGNIRRHWRRNPWR